MNVNLDRLLRRKLRYEYADGQSELGLQNIWLEVARERAKYKRDFLHTIGPFLVGLA